MLSVYVLVGFLGFFIVRAYHQLLSEQERVKIENGSVVTPINELEAEEKDLAKLGFGKLADNSQIDETIIPKNQAKLSQFEGSTYNYTVQDPYETIVKNKLNFEEEDLQNGVQASERISETDYYPDKSGFITLQPYSRAKNRLGLPRDN